MPWLRNCSGVGKFLDQKQRMHSICNLCAILTSRETTVGGEAFGGCEQLAPWISSGVLVPAGPVAAVWPNSLPTAGIAELQDWRPSALTEQTSSTGRLPMPRRPKEPCDPAALWQVDQSCAARKEKPDGRSVPDFLLRELVSILRLGNFRIRGRRAISDIQEQAAFTRVIDVRNADIAVISSEARKGATTSHLGSILGSSHALPRYGDKVLFEGSTGQPAPPSRPHRAAAHHLLQCNQ